jgi:hypothetical protein
VVCSRNQPNVKNHKTVTLFKQEILCSNTVLRIMAVAMDFKILLDK